MAWKTSTPECGVGHGLDQSHPLTSLLPVPQASHGWEVWAWGALHLGSPGGPALGTPSTPSSWIPGNSWRWERVRTQAVEEQRVSSVQFSRLRCPELFVTWIATRQASFPSQLGFTQTHVH